MMLAWQPPLAGLDDILTLLFVLFIVFFAISQVIKSRRGQSEKMEEEEEEAPPPPPRSRPPPPPRQYTAEAEELRKFLEALGKPRSAGPPVPPPPPRRVVPPTPPVWKPVRKPIAPVTVEGESDEERDEPLVNVVTGEQVRQEFKPIERVDLTKEMHAVESEVAGAMHTLAPTTGATAATLRAAEFKKMLSEKTSVRQAVVLAEVIGPPKAFTS